MHNEDNPPGTDTPLDDENEDVYKQRSRTPPSETFSHEEECHQRRKRRSPSPKGTGHDAMSRALDHHSHAILNGPRSPGDSSNQPSPFTMAIQTPWSM